MEPPWKANSKAEATMGSPLRLPRMATRASFSPVSFWAAVRRSLYFLVSLNLRRSTGRTSAASSWRPSGSRNRSRRRRPPMRIWWSHLGQASAFFSSSGRESGELERGHLRHRPSGTLLVRSFLNVPGPFLMRSSQLMGNTVEKLRRSLAFFFRGLSAGGAGGGDKAGDAVPVLDAGGRLHPATDIDGVGPHPAHRLPHVAGIEAAGEDQRKAAEAAELAPVEGLAGTAVGIGAPGVEQKAAGPVERRHGRRRI